MVSWVNYFNISIVFSTNRWRIKIVFVFDLSSLNPRPSFVCGLSILGKIGKARSVMTIKIDFFLVILFARAMFVPHGFKYLIASKILFENSQK